MQLRGEVSPVGNFRYYVEPIMVALRYTDIRKDPFSEPTEAGVLLKLGDGEKSAFVPLSIVDEEAKTVRASLVGEEGDKILVWFPPTNWGHTRFMADEESLQEIAVE